MRKFIIYKHISHYCTGDYVVKYNDSLRVSHEVEVYEHEIYNENGQ